MITTTIPIRWARVTALGALAVCFVAAGCGRGLLGISSTETPDAAGGQDTVAAVPAGLSVCFADHPASCDDTCREATRVLYTNCAQCHSGASPHGLPPWDFLFDAQKLTTESWTRLGAPPIPFARPGDPEGSAIYLRAVINKDMPPVYELIAATAPRVTAADGQILHDWIAGCLGPGPGPIDAGDSDGSGIITRDADESDGSTFPPDAPISDAIIIRDAGESDGSAFPPDAPKSEAIIRSQDADEGLPDAFR